MILVPVPTKVPPQEPEYHFQEVLPFSDPVAIDSVMLCPEQTPFGPDTVGVEATVQSVT